MILWGCLVCVPACLAPTCPCLHHSCLHLQGLAEREAITVIVDDSHSVWSQHRHNLVAVERYVYFPSSRASLGLKGPSLLDANRCGGQGRDVGRGTVVLLGEDVHGMCACVPHCMAGWRLVDAGAAGWQSNWFAVLQLPALPSMRAIPLHLLLLPLPPPPPLPRRPLPVGMSALSRAC